MGKPFSQILDVVATLAYLVLGPVVFIGPLLPFRAKMAEAKADWMHEMQHYIHREFSALRARIREGHVSQADEELVERLRTLGDVVHEMPVWPFDARTLRKFMTAYVVPLAFSLLGSLLLKAIGNVS